MFLNDGEFEEKRVTTLTVFILCLCLLEKNCFPGRILSKHDEKILLLEILIKRLYQESCASKKIKI